MKRLGLLREGPSFFIFTSKTSYVSKNNNFAFTLHNLHILISY